MSMEILTRSIVDEESVRRVLEALEAGRCPALLSGAGALPRAHAAAAVYLCTGRPMLAVCADEGEARRMAEDLLGFTGIAPAVLTGRDFVFYNAEGVSRDGERQRIAALHRLLTEKRSLTVATPDALMLRTITPDVLEELTVDLHVGATADMERLTDTLLRAGYERTAQVEGAGQFALRGGILDVFSPSDENPIRCEFWGDEIDSMGYFDVSSQRRVENVGNCLILPAREAPVTAAKGGIEGLTSRIDAYGKRLLKKKTVKRDLLENILTDLNRIRDERSFPATDRYLDLMYEPATALDYLPKDAVVMLCEPSRLSERAKNFTWQLGQDMVSLKESSVMEGGPERITEAWESVTNRMADFPVVMMASFTASQYPLRPKTLASLTAKQLPSYGGSLETAASDIAHYKNSGYSVLVLVRDKRRGEILHDYLEKKSVRSNYNFDLTELPKKGECVLAVGALSAGLEYPGMKLAVITEGQLTQGLFRRKAKRKLPSNRQKLDSFTDLSPGDLVVHEAYGIGRFAGMVKREVDGVKKDYIKIAYAGTDSLYVPATQLDAVSKYIGAGEDTPVKLSKLGGTDWTRAKTKAKAAVKDLADGLLKLQAERQKANGYAFSPDTPWQREFEDNFEYQETDDQLRAIREIKADRDEVRHGRKAGGHPGAHYGPRPAALPDGGAQIRRLPRVHRGPEPLPLRRTGEEDPPGTGGRDGGYRHRHPQAFTEGRAFQKAGTSGGGRGAAFRRPAQGAAQRDRAARGRADPVGHAHTENAEHGAVRRAGYVHHRGAALRPPAGADLRAGARLGGPL